MIKIIFAQPRTGKTAYMTYLLYKYCFDEERNLSMHQAIRSKNANGFKLTAPNHCVSANYDLTLNKFGYYTRHNRKINPFRLGYSNKYVKTHYNFPFEVIGITEAQKYLNSRNVFIPGWQSRWYEQHGHNNLEILLDTQRPKLIDVNIRDLASFYEIRSMRVFYNRYGEIKKVVWRIRVLDNNAAFERYLESGKTLKNYKEITEVADFNVFDCYNSEGCEPYFYEGRLNNDIDYQTSEPIGSTWADYFKYFKTNDDSMPEGYFKERNLTSNKEKKDDVQ